MVGKQLRLALVAGLIVMFISQLIGAGIKVLTDGAMQVLSVNQIAALLPKISWIFFILVMIFFILLIVIALQLGSKPYPIQNVKEPIGYKFKTWQQKLGLPSFWSQFRLTILSGLLIITIIVYHAIRTTFSIEHGILIFIVATDIILQFYVATGDVRNSLNRSIAQLMVTLGRQIELTLEEALGNKDSRLRIRILIYNPDEARLFVKYHYEMSGEPDLGMSVGIRQGVVGRVFTYGRPWMFNPYNPNKLGFSKEQIDQMPSNIKWKMGHPLLCNHRPFGVIAIDCDSDLELVWLDKILDFTHAIAISISILLGQFPSDEIQKAFIR
jgi:hypothetical protein